MRRAFIRAVSLFAVIFIMAGGTALPAAAKEKYILLTGDGILAGAGLPGGALSCGEHLSGMRADMTVLNMAWDSCSSFQLPEQLAVNERSVKGADYIVISAGSDDILPMIFGSVSSLTGQAVPDTSTIAGAVKLASLIPASVIDKLAQTYNVRQAFANMTDAYSSNLTSSLSYIRAVNPGARLYVLNIYYPFAGLEGESKLRAYADEMLGDFNRALAATASSFGALVIDARTAFNENSGCADVRLGSVYPTPEGQRILAKLLSDVMEDAPAQESASHTSPADSAGGTAAGGESAADAEPAWNPTTEKADEKKNAQGASGAVKEEKNNMPEQNAGSLDYNASASAARVLYAIIKTTANNALSGAYYFIFENPELVICALFSGAMLFLALAARGKKQITNNK